MKVGSINAYPQSLHVTLYLHVWLKLSKLLQTCSEVVATLAMHFINQIMNGWILTESALYVFQYATLK
jgi:hypothetical protein